MDKKSRLISGISTIFFLSLLSISTVFGVPSAELGFSKSYSGSAITPFVNEYVQYDLTIANSSDVPITNQSLWVSFTSSGGMTNVSTSFSIQDIAPGSSQLIHLGPFKMREAGEHILFIGINSRGVHSLPNEVSIGAASQPIDTLSVYEPATIYLVVGGIASIVLGVGIVFGLSRLKKRHQQNA